MVVHIGQSSAIGSRATQVQRVRGLSRPAETRHQHHWMLKRGTTITQTSVTLAGAFPGGLALDHSLERGHLQLTERYLVVDEYSDRGFALDLDDIEEISLIPSASRGNTAIRIRYLTDPDEPTRCFAIATRGIGNMIQGGNRIRSIVTSLHGKGIPINRNSLPLAPRNLALSWPEAHRHETEDILWSGEALAPCGGWMTTNRMRCKIWMTTMSIFWCEPNGPGVNRIAIEEILDLTVPVSESASRFALAIADSRGDRHELIFGIEDTDTCQSLTDALTGAGVTIRNAAHVYQPWRQQDRSATNNQRPESSPVPVAPVSSPVAPTEVARPASCISTFEASCLAEIAQLNQQIITPDLLSVTRHDQGLTDEPNAGATKLSVALEAVAAQIADGDIDIADADNRVRRLKLLAEGRAKLRAIRLQQVQGLRSKSALLHERKAVMTSLGGLLTQ